MPDIDIEKLVRDMSSAALGAFNERWPSVRIYAEAEFRKLGETVLAIRKAKESGEIKEEEARLLMDMQKNAMRSVMLTIEGLGILVVERAINAALGAARSAVNAATGWNIL